MLNDKRKAFTMIELVFVIVVLGILASVAIPKFAATRNDAHISKARSDIASIRSAIITERQGRLFRGQNAFIDKLDAGVGANTAGVTIFDNNGTAANTILQYGITTKAGTSGAWMKTGADTYTYKVAGNTATFTYTDTTGRFDCAGGPGTFCATLTD